MRDNQRLLNDKLTNGADIADKEIPSAVDNLLDSIENLSSKNQKIFFQSWLASDLPLDPELILPLVEFISENPDSEIQRLLIESAAFFRKKQPSC